MGEAPEGRPSGRGGATAAPPGLLKPARIGARTHLAGFPDVTVEILP
jgi:hypothetical protein